MPLKTRYITGCWLILAIGQLAFGIGESRADPPDITKLVFIATNVFLAFSPATSNWVAVDASADLSSWTELGNVSTTNSVTEFVDATAAQSPRRFYRLRQPGTTADEAAAKWSTNATAGCQFQLTRVNYQGSPSVLTATVTVTNGQKSVSNAQADGQPLAQPNPDDFPSIEEVFAALQGAQAAGCRQVRVIHDPTQGYPADAFIDQRTAGLPPDAGTAVRYLITGVTLSGE